MKRSLLCVALVILAGLSVRADAESHPPDAATICLRTERSEVVVCAEFLAAIPSSGGVWEATFRVSECVKGDLEPDTEIRVSAFAMGDAAPWREGLRYILFLRSTRDGEWHPVAGSFGIRALGGETARTRLVGGVRAFLGCISDSPEGRRDHLRLLLDRMGQADPSTAWDAAIDFARHHDLHGDLTKADAARIAVAFQQCPTTSPAKAALATALGATGQPSVTAALILSLRDADADSIRDVVADALARIDDPEVPSALAKALDDAPGAVRCRVLEVLGRVGGLEQARAVRDQLGADPCRVRVQAAHALGRIARNARRMRIRSPVGGAPDLQRMLRGATTPNEKIAALWGLAQLDDPSAVAVLDRQIADSPDPLIRTYARRFRSRPRQSLVLRPEGER